MADTDKVSLDESGQGPSSRLGGGVERALGVALTELWASSPLHPGPETLGQLGLLVGAHALERGEGVRQEELSEGLGAQHGPPWDLARKLAEV
jgi:hypothetical protein